MKALELHQMEEIEGGSKCSNQLGEGAGLAIAGVLFIGVAAATGGIGAIVVGAALFEAGAFRAAFAPCF